MVQTEPHEHRLSAIVSAQVLNLADSTASLGSTFSLGPAPALPSAPVPSASCQQATAPIASKKEPFMSGNDKIIPTDDPDIQVSSYRALAKITTHKRTASECFVLPIHSKYISSSSSLPSAPQRAVSAERARQDFT